jgi:hypothetical protein
MTKGPTCLHFDIGEFDTAIQIFRGKMAISMAGDRLKKCKLSNRSERLYNLGFQPNIMSDEKKACIAFIGCGSHANTSLYPAIHTIPQIELSAVCDLKEELAKRNAHWFGAGRCYTNLDEMLRKESLDGAIVVGPPQMYCEVGKRCLDAGLPIHVEKPSAVSYKEAMELAEYARKKGL